MSVRELFSAYHKGELSKTEFDERLDRLFNPKFHSLKAVDWQNRGPHYSMLTTLRLANNLKRNKV